MKLFLNILKWIIFCFGVFTLVFILAIMILPSSDYCIEDGNCPECPGKEGYTCITKEDCINGGYLWYEDDRWCKVIPTCKLAMKENRNTICWTPDKKTHLIEFSNPVQVERFKALYKSE
jgi:hypothetical protein